jgi:hypothetical protein
MQRVMNNIFHIFIPYSLSSSLLFLSYLHLLALLSPLPSGVITENYIYQPCYVLRRLDVFSEVRTHLNISSVRETKGQSKHHADFCTKHILSFRKAWHLI